MMSKRRKPSSSIHRRITRLERELATVEAQIARLEQNKSLELAERNHFALRQRAPLFVAWRSGGWH